MLETFLRFVRKKYCPAKHPETQLEPIQKDRAIQTLDDLLTLPNLLDSGSLVIFDVDDTLTTTNDLFGRMKGQRIVQTILHDRLQNGIISDIERDRLFGLMMTRSSYRLLEEKSLILIQQFQDRKIPVYVLTGLRTDIVGWDNPLKWRIDGLQHLGIDLRKGTHPDPIDLGDGAAYQDGVIVSGWLKKGEAFLRLIQRIQSTMPRQIIMIDDGLKHLQSVQDMANQQGILFKGYHYQSSILQADPDPDPKVLDNQLTILQLEGDLPPYDRVVQHWSKVVQFK